MALPELHSQQVVERGLQPRSLRLQGGSEGANRGSLSAGIYGRFPQNRTKLRERRLDPDGGSEAQAGRGLARAPQCKCRAQRRSIPAPAAWASGRAARCAGRPCPPTGVGRSRSSDLLLPGRGLRGAPHLCLLQHIPPEHLQVSLPPGPDPRRGAGRAGRGLGDGGGTRSRRPAAAPGPLPPGTPSSSLWATPSPASWPVLPSSPCWATCLRSWGCPWTKWPKQVCGCPALVAGAVRLGWTSEAVRGRGCGCGAHTDAPVLAAVWVSTCKRLGVRMSVCQHGPGGRWLSGGDCPLGHVLGTCVSR